MPKRAARSLSIWRIPRTGGMTIMPELMVYVSIPYDWKEFIYHKGSAFDHWSTIKTGLVAGGKESKEGRQIVFFTPLDPFGSACFNVRQLHRESRL